VRVRFVLAHLERGGPVEHTLSLAEAMAGEGVGVAAACASDSVAARFRAAGVAADVIPLHGSSDLLGARRIWRWARMADVVHAQDRRSGLWVRLGPKPRPGGLRVYTIHGLPDEYLELPGQPASPGIRARLAYRGLDAALCRRADVIFVPSRAFAELVVSRLGFPRDKLAVVPHGVRVPERPLLPGSLIATMGLLEPVKGADVFLRAAARLAGRDPQLRFAIFGSGSEERRLEALGRQLGIGDRVEFPGYVRRDEAFGRMRVFVVSSYLESGPLTLLEAMAAGVPVVATTVGGIPEVAVEGTAQLVRPGSDADLADAIDRLLSDDELRKRQIRAAREHVLAHHTPQAAARRTLAVYERLLRGD
jgi:glycosyltransferase involved in cell wall biosynthesis